MVAKLLAWVKEHQVQVMVGTGTLLVILVVAWRMTVITNTPTPAPVTATASETVEAASLAKDPTTIDGVTYVPLSQMTDIAATGPVITDVAINPATTTVVVANSDGYFYTTYLPETLPALMDEFAKDNATISVAPSGTTTYNSTPNTTTQPIRRFGTNPLAPATGGGGVSFGTIMLILMACGAAAFVGRIMYVRNKNKKEKEAAEKIEAEAALSTVRFEDVAGCEEAIEDMKELVDYLKDPALYEAVGAKVPHGALFSGEPGTGKTLLARALAGEAGCAFLPVSGSDFVEMYVGVGAKRVRELFAKARSHEEGCIIFIDEIETVGRARAGKNDMNPHHEQEGTLNAILTQLDGFTPREKIIVIGATNRADLLDTALMRPGRLERQIHVGLPDRRGRAAILAVHMREKPLQEGTNLDVVAGRTSGFSGAELAAVANEAALICVRDGRNEITERDLDAATATVAMGRPRTSAIVTDHDRKVTAWHEAGHAVCGIVQPEGTDVVSISVLPRGQAGGVTWFNDLDTNYLTRKAAYARLVTGMGGMAAEMMFFGNGEHTTGPSGDLQTCTNVALAMVTQYGMGESLIVKSGELLNAGTGVTDSAIAEADALIRQALEDAKKLLNDNREFFDKMVAALLEYDTLILSQIEALQQGVELIAPTPPPPPKRHITEPVPVPVPQAVREPVFSPLPEKKHKKWGEKVAAFTIAAKSRMPRKGSKGNEAKY